MSAPQQLVSVYPNTQGIFNAMFPGTASPTARFLASQPWFCSLPIATQIQVTENLLHTQGKRGEVMLKADTQVEGWYAVLNGLVKLQSVPIKGRLSTFLCVASGDWFGEGSALTIQQRRYEVVAMRDTEMLCLPHADFQRLRASSLEFNQFLVTQLNNRVSQAMALIESARLRTPEQRVALSLSRLFWGRTRKLNLSQDELANMVGISRQTANQALKSLEERGLVTLEFGRVDIPDDDALTGFIFSSPEALHPEA
jgi:CRP/FNR family cyclic AMP-dependent transcriptional regulator